MTLNSVMTVILCCIHLYSPFCSAAFGVNYVKVIEDKLILAAAEM